MFHIGHMAQVENVQFFSNVTDKIVLLGKYNPQKKK